MQGAEATVIKTKTQQYTQTESSKLKKKVHVLSISPAFYMNMEWMHGELKKEKRRNRRTKNKEIRRNSIREEITKEEIQKRQEFPFCPYGTDHG
jgi:hypothetical protein